MALQQADYVLGHTSVEQQWLIRQARVLAPLTQRFLRDAGISSGMRVLDIGCGMGANANLGTGCSHYRQRVASRSAFGAFALAPAAHKACTYA
jgi:hypothetical protein